MPKNHLAAAAEVVTELFECWYTPMVRFAARSAGNMAIGEEIVQEALMELYKELRSGRRVEHPRAWVMRVIRRRIWKQFSAHKDERLEHEPLETLNESPGNERALHDAGELSLLLHHLTQREADAVLLRAAGLGYSEIGKELGLAAGTVGALLSRALRKMQEIAHSKPAFRDASRDREEPHHG